ncbi:Rrf2 family transcriptional regulator [Candidatus Bipolaricaulota bacterium]|nr:Rrf2 family transcriptional regulator [Candidatus Bipolaricaulota bacterium]
MLYSRTAKYGIKALTYLSESEGEGYKTVDYIADRTEIPTQFLGKICQNLAKKGLLQSRKGRGGGFRLAKSGDEIPLMEVIKSLDGEKVFDRCLFDVKKCSKGGLCPLHEDWVPIRNQLEKLMEKTTIADLTQGSNFN